MKDAIACCLLLCHRFVSVNETMFNPGSITAQSSSSDSNIKPSVFVNVNDGAAALDISILTMKSRAYVLAAGRRTMTGVED